MVDTVSTQHPSQSAPWWMGAIAGVAAAAVALAFGQFIEGVSDTMPGLVLGVGELIIDYTPGWAAEESIENLGTAGKGNLLLGITIVAFLLAGLLGEQALRRGDRVGVAGFLAFGLLGGWAAARNPQSSFIAGWFWTLVAAGLGISPPKVRLAVDSLTFEDFLFSTIDDHHHKSAVDTAFDIEASTFDPEEDLVTDA